MNWPFVTRRHHRERIAEKTARIGRLAQEREDAEKLAADRQTVIDRQAAELAYYRDQNPDAPLPYPRPAEGDAELTRQLHLARSAVRALQQRLDEMQESHIADTRELHDLRQGATP